MSGLWNDFNDAQSNTNLIPKGTLAKVRLGETGERYALERLAAMDAPRRCTGEGGAEYIRRLQDEGWLRRVKHPGNFVFTWPDGRAGGGP